MMFLPVIGTGDLLWLMISLRQCLVGRRVPAGGFLCLALPPLTGVAVNQDLSGSAVVGQVVFAGVGHRLGKRSEVTHTDLH